MALSIKDNETDALVRRLAAARKLSYTGAIKLAVSNELAREDFAGKRSQAEIDKMWADVLKIQQRTAKLPELMTEAEADAWMYDENGLPH